MKRRVKKLEKITCKDASWKLREPQSMGKQYWTNGFLLSQKQIGIKYQQLIWVTIDRYRSFSKILWATLLFKHRKQSNWRYSMQVAKSVLMAASQIIIVT